MKTLDVQARRRWWGEGAGGDLDLLLEFFVFFRRKESNQNKRNNLRGRGPFAKKEEIERQVHTLRLT